MTDLKECELRWKKPGSTNKYINRIKLKDIANIQKGKANGVFTTNGEATTNQEPVLDENSFSISFVSAAAVIGFETNSSVDRDILANCLSPTKYDPSIPSNEINNNNNIYNNENNDKTAFEMLSIPSPIRTTTSSLLFTESPDFIDEIFSKGLYLHTQKEGRQLVSMRFISPLTNHNNKQQHHHQIAGVDNNKSNNNLNNNQQNPEDINCIIWLFTGIFTATPNISINYKNNNNNTRANSMMDDDEAEAILSEYREEYFIDFIQTLNINNNGNNNKSELTYLEVPHNHTHNTSSSSFSNKNHQQLHVPELNLSGSFTPNGSATGTAAGGVSNSGASTPAGDNNNNKDIKEKDNKDKITKKARVIQGPSQSNAGDMYNDPTPTDGKGNNDEDAVAISYDLRRVLSYEKTTGATANNNISDNNSNNNNAIQDSQRGGIGNSNITDNSARSVTTSGTTSSVLAAPKKSLFYNHVTQTISVTPEMLTSAPVLTVAQLVPSAQEQTILADSLHNRNILVGWQIQLINEKKSSKKSIATSSAASSVYTTAVIIGVKKAIFSRTKYLLAFEKKLSYSSSLFSTRSINSISANNKSLARSLSTSNTTSNRNNLSASNMNDTANTTNTNNATLTASKNRTSTTSATTTNNAIQKKWVSLKRGHNKSGQAFKLVKFVG